MVGRRTPQKANAGRGIEDCKIEIASRFGADSRTYQQPKLCPLPSATWGEFVKSTYLPFCTRKWKLSTKNTNEERFRTHLFPLYEERKLGSFGRDELQDLLDAKASPGFSYSTVAHLRWDLRQVFRMAVQEGHIVRNPAELLFIPRDAPRPVHTAMTPEEVNVCLDVLALRERLILKLAVLAGLRPVEIFGLRVPSVGDACRYLTTDLQGHVDSPKSNNSSRKAALAEGLLEDIRASKNIALDDSPDAWMFPSEKQSKPVWKDNLWRRDIAPQLQAAGLGWVDFHVMRRTHATLMNGLHDDPKMVAD